MLAFSAPTPAGPPVVGIGVVSHPGQVRRYIGVAAQDVTLDPLRRGSPQLLGGSGPDSNPYWAG